MVLFSVGCDWVMDNNLCGMGPVICIAQFFWANSDSFGIFKKILNFKTFQIECLWNFLLDVTEITKQSCCRGNRISRKM